MGRLRAQSIFSLLVGGILSYLAFAGTAADDALEPRVAGLEARVAALETQIASMSGSAEEGLTDLETYEIQGAFVLTDPLVHVTQRHISINQSDQSCRGANAYSDINRGLKITITDQAGSVIGMATLGSGMHVSGQGCVFEFSATVPTADFYTFSIQSRGEITFSMVEIAENDWVVVLTL